MGPEILCVGNDPVLNRTRRLMFQPYLEVRLAGNLPDAATLLTEHRFKLVLLCYSIAAEDARALVDFIHRLESRPRILALEYEGPRLFLTHPDEEFRPAGPASLLRKVAAMAGIELPEPAVPSPEKQARRRGRIEPIDS